jgi:hypothetical protein
MAMYAAGMVHLQALCCHSRCRNAFASGEDDALYAKVLSEVPLQSRQRHLRFPHVVTLMLKIVALEEVARSVMLPSHADQEPVADPRPGY